MLHGILRVLGAITLLGIAVFAFNLSPSSRPEPTSPTPPSTEYELHADVEQVATNTQPLENLAADVTTSMAPEETDTGAAAMPSAAASTTNPAQAEPSVDPSAQPPATQTTPVTPDDAPKGPVALRIENPYPFPPVSIESLNTSARAALVNIFCTSSGGSLNPISGSGIIIDPRGVVLTNAHVAQYVLLASRPELKLRCFARTGSPARASWNISVMYMPDAWVRKHAADIRSARPMGTGEHDFALLAITDSLNGHGGAPYPYIPVDSRDSIGFVDDTVLLAAYPAEFTGGLTTQNDLYASSAVTTIRELFTFDDSTVDLISLGGAIVAQSGSSGGAVLNQWGRLVGIITTTSDGKTTSERDLRAITTSYVNRAISRATGKNLQSNLAGDPITASIGFMSQDAPALIELILTELR